MTGKTNDGKSLIVPIGSRDKSASVIKKGISSPWSLRKNSKIQDLTPTVRIT